jgi:predicted transcriptional regulator
MHFGEAVRRPRAEHDNSAINTMRGCISTSSRSSNLLREWRDRRRLTQVELAFEADISPRHLSFVEIGRALSPSETSNGLESDAWVRDLR